MDSDYNCNTSIHDTTSEMQEDKVNEKASSNTVCNRKINLFLSLCKNE